MSKWPKGLIASKLQQSTQANHHPHGGKMKKLKMINRKNKSSTYTIKILGQMRFMVTLTTPHGRTTPTSDGETITIKLNNHGKETQTKTVGKTQITTTSKTITKTHTENHKTLIPTLTIIHPITKPPIKTLILNPQYPTTNQSHKTLRGSPTWRS